MKSIQAVMIVMKIEILRYHLFFLWASDNGSARRRGNEIFISIFILYLQ